MHTPRAQSELPERRAPSEVHLKPGVALSAVMQALDGKNIGDRYIEVFAADDKSAKTWF